MNSPHSLRKIRQERARRSLIEFTKYTFPLYKVDPFHAFLAGALEQAIAGKTKRLMVFAHPQSGKPCSVNSMVLMADGSYKRLGDITKGDIVVSGEGNPTEVVATHDQDEIPAIRIQTHSGRTTIAGLEHPFWTPDGWKKAEELKPGIALAKLVPLPNLVSDKPPEEYRLAGYFVGDGSCTYTADEDHPYPTRPMRSQITCFDDLQLEDIEHCCGVMGFDIVKSGKIATKRAYNIKSGSRPWLREIGLAGKKSTEKTVPDFVYSGSNEGVANFIGAYFACDGSAQLRGLDRKGYQRQDLRIEFYSSSRELLIGAQHLLLRLGIQTLLRDKVAKGGTNYRPGKDYISYRLILNAQDDVAKFIERIPVYGIKNKIFERWNGTRNDFDRRIYPDTITEIKTVNKEHCKCLTVDVDDSFTVDDFIVHNSELTSVRFPAYWLARRPNHPLILCSYAANLAQSKSRHARGVIESTEFIELFPDVQTDPSSRAVDFWELEEPHRGQMRAAGVGSGITGFPASAAVIDDPVQDWEQAQSELIRDKTWDWYKSTLRSRLWEGGSIILVMTRWHIDDLAGRLIREQGNEWTIIRCPALAETQEERDIINHRMRLPEGLPDPLGRLPGDPLCPSRFSREELLKIKAEVGSLIWSALYQGAPVLPEGNMFKRAWFKNIVDYVPEKIKRRGRYWDLAFAQDGKSRTASVLMAIDRDGIIYIEDVIVGQFGPDERNRIIRVKAEQDKRRFDNAGRMWIEEEPGSAGKDQSLFLIKYLAGYAVYADRPTGSKDVRLEPFRAQAEGGLVRLVRGAWNEEWIDEMCSIPTGLFRDQGDATAGIYSRLAKHMVTVSSVY